MALEESVLQDLMRYAYDLAARDSHDPRTKNAALIVQPDGQIVTERSNRFANGLAVLLSRLDSPIKYDWMTHAEEGAVQQLAKLGVSSEGLTMICPWAACTGCARDIINAGIANLVVHEGPMEKTPEPWQNSVAVAHGMLAEAGVSIEVLRGLLGVQIMFNGVMEDF